MKWTLMLGGLFGLGVASVHTFVGQPVVLDPMIAANYDEVAKYTMAALWHFTTMQLWLSGAVLLASGIWAKRIGNALPRYIGVECLAWTTAFLLEVATSGLENAAWVLPQWAMILPVAALAIVGSRK